MGPYPILRRDLGSSVAWVPSQSRHSVFCARPWVPLIPQPRRPSADFPPDHNLLTNFTDSLQTFSVVHERAPLYYFWRHGSLNHWQFTHHSVQQSTSFIPSFDSVDLFCHVQSSSFLRLCSSGATSDDQQSLEFIRKLA